MKFRISFLARKTPMSDFVYKSYIVTASSRNEARGRAMRLTEPFYFIRDLFVAKKVGGRYEKRLRPFEKKGAVYA